MEIGYAVDCFRLVLGLGQRRQKQGRQNCNDGNDDQQLNQGKTGSPVLNDLVSSYFFMGQKQLKIKRGD